MWACMRLHWPDQSWCFDHMHSYWWEKYWRFKSVPENPQILLQLDFSCSSDTCILNMIPAQNHQASSRADLSSDKREAPMRTGKRVSVLLFIKRVMTNQIIQRRELQSRHMILLQWFHCDLESISESAHLPAFHLNACIYKVISSCIDTRSAWHNKMSRPSFSNISG